MLKMRSVARLFGCPPRQKPTCSLTCSLRARGDRRELSPSGCRREAMVAPRCLPEVSDPATFNQIGGDKPAKDPKGKQAGRSSTKLASAQYRRKGEVFQTYRAGS